MIISFNTSAGMMHLHVGEDEVMSNLANLTALGLEPSVALDNDHSN